MPTKLAKPVRPSRSLLETALYDALITHNYSRRASAEAVGCTVRTVRAYIKRWRADGRVIPEDPLGSLGGRPKRGHKVGCKCTPCRHSVAASKRAALKDLRPPNSTFCTKCGRSNHSMLTRPNGECERCSGKISFAPALPYCEVCGAATRSLINMGRYSVCGGCALDKPRAR